MPVESVTGVDDVVHMDADREHVAGGCAPDSGGAGNVTAELSNAGRMLMLATSGVTFSGVSGRVGRGSHGGIQLVVTLPVGPENLAVALPSRLP